MIKKNSILGIGLAILSACSEAPTKKENTSSSNVAVRAQIHLLNSQLIQAAQTGDITKSMGLYEEHALLLAEYMPIIDGKEGIQQYYIKIYEREQLAEYEKKTEEVFNFGTTVLEIGTYKKSFSDQTTHSGPYWNIWTLQPNGTLRLAIETFGFFSSLADPTTQVVDSVPGAVWQLGPRKGVDIPLEFDAYGALMENIVRDRDTEKVIGLYTEDGSYTPFVDTTKAGTAQLSEHYYAYHKNPVIIDSIETTTYDFIAVPDGVLRMTQFYVEWTVPDFSGKNEGAGISYWRRQEDNSLRIHRQIGHHIHHLE